MHRCLVRAPEFVLLQTRGFCYVWNNQTQKWVTVWGTYINVWWAPIEFDGPPLLAPGAYSSDTPVTDTSNDPGFSGVKSATKQDLEQHPGDYANLIDWLDVQLGGFGQAAPGREELYGRRNPGAQNLVHSCAADPVDCATGNFSAAYQDLDVAGPGVSLSLMRTYNSQLAARQAAAGPFGFGWTARFRDWLEFPDGTSDVIVHQDNGSQIRFSYDADEGTYYAAPFAQARLARGSDGSFTYTLPTRLRFTFDSLGQLQKETDRNNNITQLAYTAGRLTTVTDAVGRVLAFTYNSDGTVASVTDPAGHRVEYGYDGQQLTSVTDVGGGHTSFEYDGAHQLTKVVDARRLTVLQNAYDAEHRVVSQLDGEGRETRWAYDGQTTTITAPDGAVTSETFIDYLPTAIVRAQGTAAEATTTISYDEDLNPVRVIDPNGGTWASSFDAHGNRLSLTDPLGRKQAWTYNTNNCVTSVKLASGASTTFSCDSHNNITFSSQYIAENNTTLSRNYSYDAHGQISSAWDDTHTWQYGYDAKGNRTSAQTPLGRVVRATYDTNGFELTRTSARGKVTTITRNAFERPAAVTDPESHTTTYEYDAALNPTKVTDREGHVTTTVFDALNRATEVHRPDGSIWKTEYTSGGYVGAQIDGLGRATSYVYDAAGRLTRTMDALGRAERRDYDAAGNLIQVVDPQNRTTSLSYDAANQLAGISYSDDPGANTTFSYNSVGQRTKITDRSGTSTYAYDSIGRLSSETNAAGQKVGYHYDKYSHLTSVDYPAATAGSSTVAEGTVQRQYNKDDQLTAIVDWLGNTTSFGYDSDGNVTTITRPNGVNGAYTYTGTNAMASVSDVGSLSLARNGESLITSSTGGGGPLSFGYDDALRLTSAGGRSYGYDAADNLTQTAAPDGTALGQEFDVANQLTSVTAGGSPVATYDYDASGERIGMTPASGAGTTLQWDQAGRLTDYHGPDRTSSTGDVIDIHYGYDGDGLRQTKTLAGETAHEVYDRSTGVPTMIEDGTTAYVYGPGGLPVEQITADGQARFFHHDQLGSTTALTNASGATIQSYDYDAYGQLISAAPTVTNPFGFTGQYTDRETGLQYLHARYYDPATGQFLSRDPLGSLTRQPYAYASDDPANFADPSGLATASPLGPSILITTPAPELPTIRINPVPEDPGSNTIIDFPGESPDFTEGFTPADVFDQGLDIDCEDSPAVGGNTMFSGSDDAAARNPADDKLITKQQERALLAAGIDPHELKEDLGRSRSDLYYDKKSGEIYVKPRGGLGPGEPTGVNIHDVMRDMSA